MRRIAQVPMAFQSQSMATKGKVVSGSCDQQISTLGGLARQLYQFSLSD
jgi:hypothetical protein